jgi:hypothetical protein
LKFIIAATLVLFASVATAQTVVDPTKVVFTASTDHNTVNILDGTPAVTGYQLDVMSALPQTGTGPLTAGALAFTIQLGKPTPDANNTIVATPTQFTTMTPNIKYVATVSAVGPGGVGVSGLSNPFGRRGAPGAPGTAVISK